ncbi:MAG: DUF6230 family protein [Mycobacteriales bacterium]
MTDAQGNTPLGRTRWRRFGVVALPSLLAAGTLMALTANGVIAASFSVSGSTFKVSADTLDGTGFEQFGSIDQDGKNPHPVAISVIGDATIHNLCQSVVTHTPIGDITLKITAGTGSTPVEATNLVLDVTQLDADATFTNIEIGRDAGTLDKAGVKGPAGTFGQQADKVHLEKVRQQAWATTAGTFKLNGLSLRLIPGSGSDKECF